MMTGNKIFRTKVVPLEDRDIEIHIGEKDLTIVFNTNTIFNTLANRENIIGLLNAKCKELIDEYLSTMAERQKARLDMEKAIREKEVGKA